MTTFIEYQKSALPDSWSAVVIEDNRCVACTRNYRHSDGSRTKDLTLIEDLKGTREDVLASLKRQYPDAKCTEM